jgi:hypothetical protein
MATARTEHTATLLLSGQVLVAGGVGLNDDALGSAELYDGPGGQFSPTGSLTTERYGATSTLLASGQVLVAGGIGLTAGYLASAELYDPKTGAWSATGSLMTARAAHTATLLDSGHVLVAGGLDATSPLTSAELYDPGTGTWTAVGSMTTQHSQHAATRLLSGQVLISGGTSDFVQAFAIAELYDPGTQTWGATGPLATGRFWHTTTLLLSGRVLAVGGAAYGTLSSSELYDPATGTWMGTGSLSTGRFHHSGTLLLDGGVLAVGGQNPNLPIQLLATAELYDPTPRISPSDVSLPINTSKTFTASGGSGTGYLWGFVTNASGGSLSGTGDYIAGATSGVTDLISVMDSLGNPASTTVSVTLTLTVMPSSASVAPHSGELFTASGGSGTGYHWALVTNASEGTISPSGLYTAGGTGGVTDVVGVTDSVGNSATAKVTVTTSGCGCGTGGDAFPVLLFGALPLLSSRRRRSA